MSGSLVSPAAAPAIPSVSPSVSRPAQEAYVAHIATCPTWCDACKRLARAADVEDGKRLGWPEPA